MGTGTSTSTMTMTNPTASNPKVITLPELLPQDVDNIPYYPQESTEIAENLPHYPGETPEQVETIQAKIVVSVFK